jgi:putative adhesin
MEDRRREILRQVAAGEVSPEEAATMLDEPESGNQMVATTTIPGQRATRLRVVRTAGWTEIVGDPGVQEAVAEGPHVARREGDTLIIEGEEDTAELPGFRFSWRRGYHLHFGDVQPLRIRMNPNLPLEVEAQAGSLRVRDVKGPIRADVQAGQTRIEGFEAALQLTARAGSVRASGRLDEGSSHVSCEAGSVKLQLDPSSSVRVTARTTLGSISVAGREDRGTWVIGDGRATLDVETTMGSVRVLTD